MSNYPSWERQAEAATLLKELCHLARQRVFEARQEGQVERANRIYLVFKATLDSSGGLHGRSSQEVREEWDAQGLHSVVQTLREESGDLFERATRLVEAFSGVDAPRVRGHLEGLLWLAGRQAIDGRPKGALPRLVTRFLDEIRGGQLRWILTNWLSGISAEQAIAISASAVIRPPRSADFDSEVPVQAALHGFGPDPSLALPDAVLVVTRKSKERPDSEIQQVVNSLCLFRLGSVAVFRQRRQSNSVLHLSAGGESRFRESAKAFSYLVSQDDQKRLTKFVSRVAPLLPVNPRGEHAEPRWIGLTQYFRALHEYARAEERTALGIAALEGVLLGKKEGENRYRLAQRAAALLGFAGVEPPIAFRVLRRAYDIRSAHYHGSLLSAKEKQDAESHHRTVLEYARLVLLKHLEIDRWNSPKTKEKEQFLQDLDESLLDAAKRRVLRRELNGGLWKLAGPQESPQDNESST